MKRGAGNSSNQHWKMLVLGILIGLAPLAAAHSRREPPFKQAHSPWNPSVRILGRKLDQNSPWKRSIRSTTDDIQHDDTFLLKFQLNAEADPVSVIFKPAQNIIHQDATFHSENSKAERIFQHQHRIYEGQVVRENDVEEYWARVVARVADLIPGNRGWARLLLRDDGAWDGSAFIDGETWHFRPSHAYERERTMLSPKTPVSALSRRGKVGGNTVILLSRDVMSRDEESYELSRRGLPQNGNSERSCSHDSLDFNLQQIEQFSYGTSLERAAMLRRGIQPMFSQAIQKRQDIQGGNSSSSFAGSIGSTIGCPTEQKVLFVGVAADCTATQVFGSTNEAKQSILSFINSVSGIYAQTFNISVGVVEMQVMDSACPSTTSESEPWNVACSTSSSGGVDLNTRLSLFSQWRANKGGGDGVGLWHLLTNCNSGPEVGVAWLSQVCQVEASTSRGSTSSGTAVTALTDRTFLVLAHEQGHSFGAIHDCDSSCSSSTYTSNGVSCCPFALGNCNAQSNFIMSPVSSQNVSNFSPCSIGNICSMYSSGLNTTCIVDPGQRTTLSENACGNGIVEPGEECDPGAGSQSNCCNVETCQLLPNALCDPASAACCSDTCQYASSGTVCRPSKNDECDTAETCTGSAPSCPADSFTTDGTACGASGRGSTCASGLCTSRDQQCAAQGSSLGITRACSQTTNSCSITCQDPRGGNSCLILDGTFTDGLECGLAGRCRKGECANGSVGNSAREWIKRYPQIAYPVIVIGSLLILLILFYLVRCCGVGAKSKKRKNLPPSAQYAQSRQSQRVSQMPPSRQSFVPPPYVNSARISQMAESNSNFNQTNGNLGYLPPSHPPPARNSQFMGPAPPSPAYR